MSDLREQLDALKAEYKTARYPGNLAEELLAPARAADHKWSRWRIGGWVTIATGIAAAILISLLHTKPIVQPQPGKPTVIAQTPASTKQTTTDDAFAHVAELSTESFPDDIPLVPSGESLVPSAEALDLGSMPSFPTLDLPSLSSIEESS